MVSIEWAYIYGEAWSDPRTVPIDSWDTTGDAWDTEYVVEHVGVWLKRRHTMEVIEREEGICLVFRDSDGGWIMWAFRVASNRST